jgi:hypothetical protein
LTEHFPDNCARCASNDTARSRPYTVAHYAPDDSASEAAHGAGHPHTDVLSHEYFGGRLVVGTPNSLVSVVEARLGRGF